MQLTAEEWTRALDEFMNRNASQQGEGEQDLFQRNIFILFRTNYLARDPDIPPPSDDVTRSALVQIATHQAADKIMHGADNGRTYFIACHSSMLITLIVYCS